MLFLYICMLRCFIAHLVLRCQLNCEMMTAADLLAASYFNILYNTAQFFEYFILFYLLFVICY